MEDSKAASAVSVSSPEQDAIAQRLLADEEFLDHLYEKMRARDEIRSAHSTDSLAKAALEGARVIRETLYGHGDNA